jgi:hypothetical protein
MVKTKSNMTSSANVDTENAGGGNFYYKNPSRKKADKDKEPDFSGPTPPLKQLDII